MMPPFSLLDFWWASVDYLAAHPLALAAVVATAADNATASLSQLWSNTYIAVCKAGEVGSGGENEPDGADVPLLGGLGTDAFWEGYAPGGVVSADKDAQSFEGGIYVESYPNIELDAQVLRLKMSNKPYIANTRCLDLIATQYS